MSISDAAMTPHTAGTASETVLDDLQRRIERLRFDLALDNAVDARARCRDVVKALGTILAAAPAKDVQLVQFADDVLALYTGLKASTGAAMSMGEKLLWISSKINGSLYFPASTHSVFIDSCSAFADDLLQTPPGLDIQWTRLNDIAAIDWTTHGVEELYQDVSSDCSFISSLLSASQSPRIDLLDSITPHGPSQKYAVRLFVNGCSRTVIVDDRVPVLNGSRDSMQVRSAANGRLLWPALLEKAYFKLWNNGYDHRGSNFAVDAYILTGWLLNYTYVRDLTDEKIATYHRLFRDRKAIFGLGTGSLTAAESQFYNILPNHDYSIQDIQETGDHGYRFTVKNPLLTGTDDLRTFTVADLQMFDTIYSNVDPDVFAHRTEISFVYQKPAFDESALYYSPQFQIENHSANSIAIQLVLEKHLVENDMETDNYIKVDIYRTDGERLWSNNHLRIVKGTENNSRYYAAYVTLSERTCTVVAKYKTECRRPHSFTLRAFSMHPFSLTKARNRFLGFAELKGAWTPANSFGNALYNDYIRNPHYKLRLPAARDSSIEITLCLISKGIHMNLDIFLKDESDEFKFLTSYDSKNLIACHNEYKSGYVTFDRLTLLTNRTYILVASTNKPAETTVPYSLLVNYDDSVSTSIEYSELPLSLGLFSRKIYFDWANSNRKRLTLTVQKRATVQLRLAFASAVFSDYRSRLKVAIFRPEDARDELTFIDGVADFQDKFYGIFLALTLESGSYVIVAEREDRVGDRCSLEIGADSKFVLSEEA